MKLLRDYAKSGMSIQQAMVDHVTQYPDKTTRPEGILWQGIKIKTTDRWAIPTAGHLKAEFISSPGVEKQGFDIKVDGYIELSGGEHVCTLRTWNDNRFVGKVQYDYVAPGGQLWVWNVFQMPYPNGTIQDEKWTGNSGFWVEANENTRVYHCSPGYMSEPDFESLVFSLTVCT